MSPVPIGIVPCGHCTKPFMSVRRLGRRDGRSKFCSRVCANAQRSASAEWRRAQKVCGVCKQEKHLADFREKRLVCKACISSQRAQRLLENGQASHCEQCGSLFQAVVHSGYGLNRYCGKACADAAMVRKGERPCLNCGEIILRALTAVVAYCGHACRAAHSNGSNNPGWKGGIAARGTLMVYVGKRQGFSSPRWALHRVIASAFIGRRLTRAEYVIHIDSDNANNEPSNLFVCESQSEWRRRFVGVSLPWPTTSNLETLAHSHRVMGAAPCTD